MNSYFRLGVFHWGIMVFIHAAVIGTVLFWPYPDDILLQHRLLLMVAVLVTTYLLLEPNGQVYRQFGPYQMLHVPNTPRIWQDMSRANFRCGLEEHFIRRATGPINQPPRIVGVAFRHPSGVIFVADKPYRHYHLVYLLKCLGLSKSGAVAGHNQGFITNTGHYVDRKTALAIAIAANQLIDEPRSELFSEEVWEIPEYLNINKPKDYSP